MARSRPVIQVGWFLREWMDYYGLSQANVAAEAGWSKTTVSLLYNCQQDYNPALVKAAALALKVREYELFLHPEEAHHIRRLRNAVEDEHRLRSVQDHQRESGGKPPEDEQASPKRRAS